MKSDIIQELLCRFENACYEFNGVECWSARELQLCLITLIGVILLRLLIKQKCRAKTLMRKSRIISLDSTK